MKKIIIILVAFSLTACMKKDVSSEMYQSWYQELQEIRKSDEEFPFTISTDIEELVNGEYMYHVIIDEVKEPIENIRAMVIHDMETEDVFPSIGLFDEPVSLFVNPEGETKGIALVGYFQKTENHITLKVKIEYTKKEISYTQYKILSFDNF